MNPETVRLLELKDEQIRTLHQRVLFLEGLFDFSDPEVVLHHAPNDPVTAPAVVVLLSHYEGRK